MFWKYKVLYKSLVLFWLTWIWSVRMFYHQTLADRQYAVISLWESAVWVKNKLPNLSWMSAAEFSLIFLHNFCLGTNSFSCSLTHSFQHSFTHSKHSFTNSFTHLITHSLLHSHLISYVPHSSIHAFTWTLTNHSSKYSQTFYLPSWVKQKFLSWRMKFHN